MRSRNPELMKAIRGYVESYYREHLSSPPIRNISEATGIPRATVQRYLVDMDSRGMLEYSGRVAASPAVAKCTTGYVSAPRVGAIRSGSPVGAAAGTCRPPCSAAAACICCARRGTRCTTRA